MDVARQIQYWRSGADDAIKSAELLVANGRFGLGLFLLHLAMEKSLKALVVKASSEPPPRTHDLLLLAGRARLQPSPIVLAVLGEFQAYCLAGRYPDADPAPMDRTLAEHELARGQEAYTWLQNQLGK